MSLLQSIINYSLSWSRIDNSNEPRIIPTDLINQFSELPKHLSTIVDPQGRSYLDQINPHHHSLSWLAIFTPHLRHLIHSNSHEIYSYLWLLKLSIPKLDAHQLSLYPKLIIDIAKLLDELATNDKIIVEELNNQKLAILKLLLNLKSKLLNQNLLNPIHSIILKLCLITKMYPIGLKLIEAEPYLDIDAKLSPIIIEDYLTYYYYAALIYLGYKEYSKAIDHIKLAIVAPGQNISKIQIEAVKKGILINLMNFSNRDQQFFKLIKKFNSECEAYLNLISLIKENYPLDQLNHFIQVNENIFNLDNNLGLVHQLLKSFYPSKIYKLEEFKLITFNQLGEFIGLNSVNELEGILVDLIQRGDIHAKISFNSSLGDTNGLVEFFSNQLPPNSRERFDQLQKDIQSTLKLNKYLQKSNESSATKGNSKTKLDPEALAQIHSAMSIY